MGLSGWVGIPTKTPLVGGCGCILKLVSSADAIWAHVEFALKLYFTEKDVHKLTMTRQK